MPNHYFPHPPVNTGGERCCVCDRVAVGASISGHLLCATHAGWAAVMAEELAREKAASAKRRGEQFMKPVAPASPAADAPSFPTHRRNRDGRQAHYDRLREQAAARTEYPCGHPCTPENTYHRRDSKYGTPTRDCRTCQLERVRLRKKTRGRVGSPVYSTER